jgi:two-component system, OmpR family, phosphate regulon sensor histidine kinase PhoR
MSLFSNKNTNPKYLAIISASTLTLLVLVMLIVLGVKWMPMLICTLVFFCICYFLFLSTIENFFFKKVKLIYKLINQTKASYKEEALREITDKELNLDIVHEDVEKWAQEKYKEINVLKETEQYRKEFLMNFAHEVKTPIFSAQGYIENLLDGSVTTPELKEKFLNNASKSIDRLAELMKDIDAITKLESGVIEMNKERIALLPLIKEVFEELQLHATKDKVNLVLKDNSETNVYAIADKLRIKQVLSNLITNAIKYNKENGLVEVGVYTVDEENLYVEVTDNGDGIAEEHIARIFERFYRTDRARDRKIGGSGLGLSIVKHIIEAHGHTLTCRSSVGVGSSFGFGLTKA